MPKFCVGCGVSKGTGKFTAAQWKMVVGGMCRKCNKPDGSGGGGSETIITSQPEKKSAKSGWVPSELPTRQCADPSCGNEGEGYRRCHGCQMVYYCSERCQASHWGKKGDLNRHKPVCEAVRKGASSATPSASATSVAAPACASGGSSAVESSDIVVDASAAAVRGGGLGAAAADDADFKHVCPICLDNEDDVVIYTGNDSHRKVPSMCTACGQMYCGLCQTKMLETMESLDCPTCRAPLEVAAEEDFKRCMNLVHDRSPGRHTLFAQFYLGGFYSEGRGVKQSQAESFKWYHLAAEGGLVHAQNVVAEMYDFGCNDSLPKGRREAYDAVPQDKREAIKWYRMAADQGSASAQANLGSMYVMGEGVPQDLSAGLACFQSAAEQGVGTARTNLDRMQQRNNITAPPPGTAVTTILLRGTNGAKYNGRPGKVVKPTKGVIVKQCRALVLLDGEAEPKSFKLMNVRITLNADHRGRAADPVAESAFEHVCTSCWSNDEDATVNMARPSLCYECGNMTCGACKEKISRTGKCPTCRSKLHVSAKANFKRVLKLVHSMVLVQGTPPGRHLPKFMHMLGTLYREGAGVRKDLVQAIKWVRAAAEQGYGTAQFDLGTMIQFGRGTPKNLLDGMMWKMKAAQNGAVHIVALPKPQ